MRGVLGELAEEDGAIEVDQGGMLIKEHESMMGMHGEYFKVVNVVREITQESLERKISNKESSIKGA